MISATVLWLHLIGLVIVTTVTAELNTEWNLKQKCYVRKGGVCVRNDHPCLFEKGTTWWRGCPEGYLCCVPPPPTEHHQRITTIQCGRVPVANDENFRVIGGFKVSLGELPWQALIRNFDSAHCGGAVLSERWILTAAHCLYFIPPRSRSFSVSTGITRLDNPERSEQHVEIEDEMMHPKFNEPIYANDIALLKLRRPLRFDNFTQPICLPRRKDTFDDRVCTVSGWGWNGKQYAHNLTALNLPTITRKKCKLAPISGPHVYEENLCAGFDAGERDSCQGDSGGPFACRMDSGQWVLPGIVSWGVGCALEKEPAVFTKVTSFLDWIEAKTGLKWD